MDETTTLPAADFPDVIREGCALVLTRTGGVRRTATGPSKGIAVLTVPTGEWDWPIDALAIDLTRASGQWAVALWLLDMLPDGPCPDTVRHGLLGQADPAELRRVALEVRGG